ncbi:MAG: DUF4388 domain-containing protein [Thermoanaerobaculia bacterium]|nr:DUF4388 domain-containing protein [Thermoanaerobaculia bacterium]
MPLKGSLDEVPLPNIIQMVLMSGKTGGFVLESASKAGEIYLRDGEIVHAQVGRLRGEEALYEFAIWQEGDFAFEEDLITEEHSIESSTTNLLMNVARRIEEWQILSKKVPSMDLIPNLAGDAKSTSMSFSPREWAVISKIDGRRTIDEIGATLDLPAFEVSKLLYGLVASEMVEFGEEFGQRRAEERLQRMSRSELTIAAKRIYEHARLLLAGHDGLAEVDVVSDRTLSEILSGRGADAVLEMIRSIEQALSSVLGSVKSRVFTDRVHQELGRFPPRCAA